MKLNYDQVASRKDKAARFVRDVLGDELRAEEIEDESVEDYAERRRIDIVESNPRRADMALTKKQQERLEELEAENAELEEKNAELEEKLDSILDIAEPEEQDDDPEGDDEDDLNAEADAEDEDELDPED